MPPWLRTTLRAVGLVGWAWVLLQALVGIDPAGADVASLVLWVYGWVGLALVSAFVGPAWHWIDPFATLHDAGAGLLQRLGVAGWTPAEYPERLAAWPAVIGFVVFVWLELVLPATRSGRPLAIAMLAYTAWTLAMMAQYGRVAWRARGEVFSVWFAMLGRLAPFALVADDEGRWEAEDATQDLVRRQRLPDGLLHAKWDTSRVILVAVATGAILFDGLSQTQVWFDLFGAPGVARETLLLAGWLGVVCLAVLLVARPVGRSALGAGLLPIALGYLIAHYLTYLIGDGQRIVAVLSDPLGRGWNVIGLTEYDPTVAFLPPGLVWAAQIVAVVGGHVVGAWAGHRAAIAETLEAEPGLRPGEPVPARDVRRIRAEQVPLAALMVALTALTLWSLGQAVVKTPDEASAPRSVATDRTASVSAAPDLSPPDAGSATAHVFEAYSSNWAGYALTGGRYTSVAATWTVPRVTPTAGRSASAMWVGIDGAQDGSLIQAGTEQDSTYGRVRYFAWWEILPAPAVRITSFTVRPGDRITTTIRRAGPGRWLIIVRDGRSGSFSTVRAYRGRASSAEWIVEAPVENGRLMPLAALAPATFDLASANGSPAGLTIDSRITLQRGATRAAPSAPDSDGDGFTIRRGVTTGSPSPS